MSRIFGQSLSASNFMIVSSETLARLCKRTCSLEPSLITYVVSTSRLFMKFIWGTAQVDFMFGFDWKQNKTVNSAFVMIVKNISDASAT